MGSELADGFRRCLYRSLVVLQLFPKLLCERMQVGVLVFSSVSTLTGGEDRGVAPADVLSAFFRSRRLHRVATATTSTRLCPLKVLSSDLAAARDVFYDVADGGG